MLLAFCVSMGGKLGFIGADYRSMADVMLRITGERIATPACGLVRNDKRNDTICADFGATR